MPCPYANIFSKPSEGAHSISIFDFAVVDTVLTIILTIITAYRLNISFAVSFTSWFIIGEILHYYFRVKTKFLQVLGITSDCS